MPEVESFRDELVARLRYLIELRGKSVSQVEKDLGRSRGFLGDALRGGKRLPLETILEVLELLKVDPARFFAGSTPEERRWGRYAFGRPGGAEVADADNPLSRIRETLEPTAADEVEGLARALRAVIALLDRKGYVSREELRAALAAEEAGSRS